MLVLKVRFQATGVAHFTRVKACEPESMKPKK